MPLFFPPVRAVQRMVWQVCSAERREGCSYDLFYDGCKKWKGLFSFVQYGRFCAREDSDLGNSDRELESGLTCWYRKPEIVLNMCEHCWLRGCL